MTRRDRLAARLVRLYLGLGGFGVSLALMVRARLGLGRWDVPHQGIARHLGMQLGWATIDISGLVLLAWIPLRQRPGPGTVSNAITVGPVVNSAPDVPPAPGSVAWRGVACRRDRAERAGHRLLHRRRPWPRPARRADDRHGRAVTCCARCALIELSVLAIGSALGGTAGAGAVACAVSIGPLTHMLPPRLTASRATRQERSTPP